MDSFLKVVYAKSFLASFVCLKESTFETRKKYFLFYFKSFLFLFFQKL